MENKLTGPMPGWVLSSTKNVDVSYNHFTWDRVSAPKKCEQDPTNVVESYSSITNEQSNIHPCLRKDFPCTKSYEQQICSLYINCGDYDVTVNNTNYEGDTERKGPSSYYNAGNWAFSSTGAFVYDIRYPNTYILSNTSNLNNISTVNTALYTKARTAANSLTYYGLCLMNGHYTVRLHFAEIVFTEYSPRKRVFDVYVQNFTVELHDGLSRQRSS
ncbi:putative Malectin domain-containing protein [Helianthus annuus]|uniref:Malectin domain-containing protein n=3 Tax=Helianthus annuus TaxID=4232 RepID=A0A9K3JLX8_HELAN|nr:putative Malectin domain-containing protein [Helianthus annuus]KAJ0617319.1 putative Malectin domain-containing protein [Helianthus annuus]KAJ0950232.1 putative Malectin domain-containing protein [Helianthus annuus]